MASLADASVLRAGPKLAIPARTLILGALALTVLLQVQLALTKSVNWDEFFHFSQIHEYRRGLPTNPTQSPHVWLFWWIADLPGTVIDHILAIRVLMLPFELATLAIVIDLARRFASREAAWLCGLALISGGYAFTQSLSLRADTIAASLMMVAVWIALTRRIAVPWALAIASLLALATIATIKVVFYAPVMGAALLVRWQNADDRAALARAAITIAAVTPALFFAAISWSQPDSAGVTAPEARSAVTTTAQASADRMFAAGLFPRGFYLLKQIALAPVLAAVLAFAPIAIMRSSYHRPTRLALGCLLLPLASVVIYRNAFPYFYAFILPPVLVAAAPAMERAVRRYGAAALAGLFMLSAVLLSVVEDRAVLARQRTVEQGIATVFPQPVWHFSEDNFPGAFPRGTRYLVSGWGLEAYRNAGSPQFSAIMDSETVPMVLANGRALNAAFSGKTDSERLLSADEQRLRESYIPHWGYLMVAGKRIPAGPDSTTIEVHVPGIYTVEDAPLTIDGRAYRVGDTLDLERGAHRIGEPRVRASTLRWGNHLPRPAAAFPAQPLYSDY